MDNEMEREAQSHVRGAPVSSRVDDEWRDPEPVSDDQPEAGWIPEGERPEGAPEPLTGEELEARSQLGRAVPRSALPADRSSLLRAAEQLRVTPDVRVDLERLPDDRIYHTVYEIWDALGYGNEAGYENEPGFEDEPGDQDESRYTTETPS